MILQSYQFAALLSAISGSAYYFVVTSIYGASSITDQLFIVLAVCAYMSIVPQIIWGGFIRHYVDVADSERLHIESFILITTVAASLLLMAGSAIYLNYFVGYADAGLSIRLAMIMPLFLVIEAFKKIQIGRGAIGQAYKSDTILWGLSCILIVVFGKRISPILILLISACTSLVYLLLTTRIRKIEAISHSALCRKIFRESLVLKSGAIIYLAKDFLIPLMLTSCGEGTVTKYSFANKFHSVMMSVMVFSTLESTGNISGFLGVYGRFSTFARACARQHVSVLAITQVTLVMVWYVAVYQVLKLKSGIYAGAMFFYIALIPLFWIQTFEAALNKFLTMVGGFKSILFVSVICLCLYASLFFGLKVSGFSLMRIIVGITLIHTAAGAAFFYLIGRIIRSSSSLQG